jgi:hypothetical protein
MSDRPEAASEGRPRASNEREELRTIAFRLREIQRLLGARVEQENRRLEAEGVDPVTDHGFFQPDAEAEGTEGGERLDG